MGNKYELHDEMLATTDEEGHRVYLHPEDVKGKWRTRRSFFYTLWILIYFGLPFIKIGKYPAIFLNLPERQFHLFGMTFFAHDAPMLFFIFAGFVFFFAFLTSMWGRVWCGWGCPQTVFIDRFFLKLERLIEGNARQREKLMQQPMNAEKFFKRAIKWMLFLLASFAITHGFLAYFLTPQEAYTLLWNRAAHPSAFIVLLVSTLIIIFDFGWFREQFCIIACPYGRIQAVFQDENSMIVSYDPGRGEPRKGQDSDKQGDCVNCYACVKVCPTGIDIRRGTQLECIGCTACIDACDDIMQKVGKPQGLIRYDSENAIEGKKTQLFRIRSLAYATILLVCIVGFFVVSQTKKQLKINFIRGGHTPYQLVTVQGEPTHITNQFRIFLSSHEDKNYSISFKSKDPSVKVVIPMQPIKVSMGNVKTVGFFQFDSQLLKNGQKILQVDVYNNGKYLKTVPVTLLGPLK